MNVKKASVNFLSALAVSAGLSSAAHADLLDDNVKTNIRNVYNTCTNASNIYTSVSIKTRPCLKAITDLNLSLFYTLNPIQQFSLISGCDWLESNPRSSSQSLLSENFNCALHYRDKALEGERDPKHPNGLALDLLYCMHGSRYKTESFVCENINRRNEDAEPHEDAEPRNQNIEEIISDLKFESLA